MPTAIVLSGGGAKGDFELGALRFIYDQGVRPDILCGTSVGSINAIKLAEGEDPANPRQGLAGLEAIWGSLRQNSDMYLEEEWLYHPDMNGHLRDYLTGRASDLGIDPPANNRSEWGTEVGRVVSVVEGGVFLATDGQSLLKSLKLLFDSQSLYNLNPIRARLQAELDTTKIAAWAAGGNKLRLAMVNLETGRLRFATEASHVLERDGAPVMNRALIPAACQVLGAEIEALEGDIRDLQEDLQDAAPPQKAFIVQAITTKRRKLSDSRRRFEECVNSSLPERLVLSDIRDAVLASASIPAIFPPVVIAGETYVDGGVRDILPLQVAVDLGANVVYAISASAPDLDASCEGTHNHGNYTGARLLNIVKRGLTDILINEIATDDKKLRIQTLGGFLPEVFYIQPDIDLHDVTTVDPGLVQIARDYGYMRAADTIGKIEKSSRRWGLSTEIACLRKTIWATENRCFGFPDPTRRAEPTPFIPELGLLSTIEQFKSKLQALINERRALNGPMPANVDQWSGRLELHPWHSALPGSAWSSRHLLGSADNKGVDVAVGHNADGRLEVFTIGTDNGIYHYWQKVPSGGWSGENRFGTPDNKGVDLAVGRNADGRLEVFTIGTDNGIYHYWQEVPSGGWSGENRLGTPDNRAVKLAVAQNADGRLEVFTIGTDNCLYHYWQEQVNGSWSSESLLGGPDEKAINLAVGRNSDGRLEVFTIGGDTRVYHYWQNH